MDDDVVVQWIRVVYTKQSRGAPGATVRAALPTGFRLPDHPAPLRHLVTMNEAEGFRPVAEVDELVVPRPRGTAGHVSFQWRDDELLVRPETFDLYGVPLRRHRPPPVGLAPGQWIRWQHNHRTSYTVEWTYYLDTINIGRLRLEPDVFLGTPTRHIDERARLR